MLEAHNTVGEGDSVAVTKHASGGVLEDQLAGVRPGSWANAHLNGQRSVGGNWVVPLVLQQNNRVLG